MPSNRVRRRILGTSIPEFNSPNVSTMPDPVDPERAPDESSDLPVDLVGWATGHRLTAAAAVDDLTGALRRGAGLQALTREIARFHRFGGKGVATIFIDVDGLKRVN